MTFIKIGERKIPAEIETRREDSAWDKRESKAIKVKMTFEEAINLFIDGLEWSVVNEYTDEEDFFRSEETAMDDYIIAGALSDNRNGTITARMGKFKTEELQAIPLAATVGSYKEAVYLRKVIEETAQSINDENEALAVKNLFPAWKELCEKNFVAKEAGFKFRYGNELYKTLQTNYTFVSHYIPDEGTESLFARIDETHVGTFEDPIPYNGNMALENGKYYSENKIVYLCIRDSVNPIYGALSDLVGNYVEVV